jgi:thiosulfate/3-mercaptopyruvate sulfurtransferase
MRSFFKSNRIILPLAVAAVGVLLAISGGALLTIAAQSGKPAAGASRARQQGPPLSGRMLMSPEAVAKLLPTAKGKKAVIIQVGFYNLYAQAHIPGSEYLGPASRPEGLAKLQERVRSLPHDQFIVLYCGCCPWSHCPNIKPAYEALHAMGFSNVKVMHITDNFGTDWVNKGYPTKRE